MEVDGVAEMQFRSMEVKVQHHIESKGVPNGFQQPLFSGRK